MRLAGAEVAGRVPVWEVDPTRPGVVRVDVLTTANVAPSHVLLPKPPKPDQMFEFTLTPSRPGPLFVQFAVVDDYDCVYMLNRDLEVLAK